MLSASSTSSHFMPPEATAVARHVDALYGFLLIASFISCVLVIGGLIYFAVVYRRKSDNDKTPYISHSTTLEFLWSFIPFMIFMVVFVWGWFVYSKLRTMPENALEIAVQAQKWNWTFTYKNGRVSGTDLYVPVNTDVRLVMNSIDVIHSFYVPAFRTKQDVVPGRYTSLWFRAEQEGNYQVFCAEYCGDNHSAMKATIHVVSLEKFEQWLSTEAYKGLSMLEIGKKIYETHQCISCHSTDGSTKLGPTWKGIWGEMVPLEGGGEAKVDENYIRESVYDPNAKIVKGFQKNVMPTQAGQLNEQELAGVIEYIKSLK